MTSKKSKRKKDKESDIQKIVNHYFRTKGLSLKQIKQDAKKKRIIYSRYTRPAKELLELAGGVRPAKRAISRVAKWAKSRDLDYALETAIKKWLELDRLEPRRPKKRAFYDGKPMVEKNKKWYVISDDGEWLEFADSKDKIEWKIVK